MPTEARALRQQANFGVAPDHSVLSIQDLLFTHSDWLVGDMDIFPIFGFCPYWR
jgi:hypothetical protein